MTAFAERLLRWYERDGRHDAMRDAGIVRAARAFPWMLRVVAGFSRGLISLMR